MQNNPQPYRFSGLTAIIGLVFLIVGLIILFMLTEIRIAAWIAMGTGAAFLAVAFIMEFRHLSGAVTGRRGRLNLSTTVMASIFIGIVILANGISFNNFDRFDTTALGQFTLSEQTKNLLQNLKAQVDVLSFYEPGNDIGSYADNLLTEYERYTTKLSHKTIDPVAHPDQAAQFGITQSPAFVFETQTKRKLVSYSDIITMDDQGKSSFEVEHPFSSALLEVTGVAQKKVYFLTGDGERDIYSDYSYAGLGLLDDLYQVGTINLLTNPTIPSDCATLIIASPKSPLSSVEVDIINAYLKSGGQAMILADPNFSDGLNQICSAWGIDLTDGTVIDPGSNLSSQKDTPLVTETNDTFGLPTTYFPGAVALVPQDNVAGNIGGRKLLVTSNSSWLDKNFTPSTEPTYTEGTDVKGPLILGILVAASPPANAPPDAKTTRLVIMGDSDFASNQNFANGNNGDLFLNSVSWLTEETQLITIHRNVLPFRRLVVTTGQSEFIQYSSIVLPPVAVLLVGVVIWWRRR